MSSPSPAKVDASVKAYLLEKDLANLLERFIVSCVEHRPSDVLEFMERWAREKRGQSVPSAAPTSSAAAAAPAAAPAGESEAAVDAAPASAATGDDRPPQDPRPVDVVVRETWASIADKATVGTNFFKILFLQHASLKRTLLKGLDYDVLAATLTDLFGRLVEGTLTDDEIKALGDANAAQRGLEAYHHQYFITAMFMALKMSLGSKFESTSTHWQQFLTAGSQRVASIVKIEDFPKKEESNTIVPVSSITSTPRDPTSGGADGSADPDPAALAAISVQESWAGIADKNAVSEEFFRVLLIQHASLKRTLLKGLEVPALVPVLSDVFGRLVEGTLTDDEIKALGDANAAQRGLEAYHHQYFITAMLMALSIVLKDKYSAASESWRKFLAEASWRVNVLVPLANVKK